MNVRKLVGELFHDNFQASLQPNPFEYMGQNLGNLSSSTKGETINKRKKFNSKRMLYLGCILLTHNKQNKSLGANPQTRKKNIMSKNINTKKKMMKLTRTESRKKINGQKHQH